MQAITTNLNISATNNSTGYDANLSIGGILFCLVLTPLTSLFGLITNGITIVLLLTTKKWDATFILFLCLTIADFFSLAINCVDGVINIINFAAYQSSSDKLFQESIFKNILIYANYITLTLSKPINSLISIQRCIAVVRPLTFKNFWTKKNTFALILAFTSPVILLGIFDGLFLERAYYIADYDAVTMDIMLIILKVIWFIFPVFVTFCVNCVTFWSLKQNRNRIENLDASQRCRRVMERELTKQLFLVTTIFVVFNTPLLCSGLLADRFDTLHVIDNGDKEVISLVYDASIFLALLNMSVNCIVFVFRNPRYRSKFMTLFRCGSHESR